VQTKAKQRQLSAELLELQNKLLGCDDDQYDAVQAQVVQVEEQIAANMEKLRGLEPAATEPSDAVLPDDMSAAITAVQTAQAQQRQLSAQLLELQNKLLGCEDDQVEGIKLQVADVEAQIAANKQRVSESGMGLSESLQVHCELIPRRLNAQLAQAQREMLQASTKEKKKAHKERCAELDAMISAAQATAKLAAKAAEEMKVREAATEEEAIKVAAKKAAQEEAMKVAAKKAAQEAMKATKKAEEAEATAKKVATAKNKAEREAEANKAAEEAIRQAAKKIAEEVRKQVEARKAAAKSAAEEQEIIAMDAAEGEQIGESYAQQLNRRMTRSSSQQLNRRMTTFSKAFVLLDIDASRTFPVVESSSESPQHSKHTSLS
jgi:chemotaxis protein histidine kinase CheA